MALLYVVNAAGIRLTYGDSFVVWRGVIRPRPLLRRRRRRSLQPLEIGMTSYTAAATLVRLVSDFAQRQPQWAESTIYETKPDERWDLTLVSRRVYGNPDEALTVMAAAGLDSVEQELTERRLVLPTARQLALMKERAGFVNDPWQRTAEQAADPVSGR